MTAPVLKVVRAKEILANPFESEEELSDREKQVARLAARGNDNERIAAELGLTPSTVSSFLGRVTIKLRLSRQELTQKMVERLEEALK